MAESLARTLFARFLSAARNGDGPDFEAFAADHPAQAAELRNLHAEWKAQAAAPLAPAETLPLTRRLTERFGEGVDPRVELQADDAGGESFSSQVIARLADRTSSFGRYRLKGEIARGGMGAILKIWDEDLHRHLAMKVILGQAEVRAGGDTPAVETAQVARFLEEAQVTGQLDHPGIVPVHELGLDPDGRVYFTMKLVKGETLRHVFDRVRAGEEGWSQTRALGVLLKVCEAMAYAHDKGVIHRDLKPGNVMVGKFGEVHVMDWGLARILGQDDAKDIRIREQPALLSTELRTERDDHRGNTPESPLYTMDGDVVGTPAYMPPEQAAGTIADMGPHSDVYAMGAMLYHLLAGHMPYVPTGARLNNYAIWALVQQSAPTPIQKLAPETPAELVAICEKAMARDWKQRYPDMSALADDLSAYLEHRVVSAHQTGAWAETKKWIERNKPLAASLAAGVLALVAGLIVSLSLKQRAETNEETAKREKANVLRLSAFQTLDDLTREADGLWPIAPELVERERAWVRRADELVGTLPELRATLAEIEQRALPQTPEERAADRAEHPRAQELETRRGRLHWVARMLGKEPWPDEAQARAALAAETLPESARELNALARSLIDPGQPAYGSEMRAWLLAQRALGQADTDAERAELQDTLARALGRLGRFEQALAAEERAIAVSPADRKPEYEGKLAGMRSAVEGWRDPSGTPRAERVQEWSSLGEEVAALERELDARQHWSFPSQDDLWWHAQLQKLIGALSSFADERTGLVRGACPNHGWGVERRAEFAATLRERSVGGPEAARRWSAALDAIATCPIYKGAQWPDGKPLTPQLGLLPIGADPDSGLWEFTQLASGEPAERGPGGKIVLRPDMALVFVLVPGGTFRMGAQSADPTEPNYDPQAQPGEAPVHELTLAPFFLSKYEMTQGQWMRLAVENPSQFNPANYSPRWNRAHKEWSALQPVEKVTFFDCERELARVGLVLPTEAQWEYGARAGTTTVYWSGKDAESLHDVDNVADAYAKEHGAEGWTRYGEWDDGNTVPGDVGGYRANAFGLHDVHGNVCEWCRDGFDAYEVGTRAGDGERLTHNTGARVVRGGVFGLPAAVARSAARTNIAPDRPDIGLGLRPALRIAP